MMLGGQLSKIYGQSTAFSSILIGNFILWLLGFAIITMAKKEFNAIENIIYYLGKRTAILTALIWIFSFLMWFTVRIKATSETIGFLSNDQQNLWILGGSLGLMTAALSMRGLCFIKKISYFLFPCLVLLAIFFLAISNIRIEFLGNFNVSLIGVLSVVFVWLPVTLNLPTIFRYSHSWAHSIVGLTLVSVSHIFFQTFAILTGFDHPTNLFFQSSGTLVIIFFLFSSTLGNLLNIYFAKNALDTISQNWKDRLKYLTIGVVGTFLYLLFFFLPPSFSTQFLEEILLNYLAILCVVLLFDFFIKAVFQHRPRPLEKFWSSICWFAGCFVSTTVKLKSQLMPEKATLVGVIACFLFFLILIFIEETIWSIRKLLSREKLV